MLEKIKPMKFGTNLNYKIIPNDQLQQYQKQQQQQQEDKNENEESKKQ